MTTVHDETTTDPTGATDPGSSSRRGLVRAALLGGPLALAAVAGGASPARAAPATATWKLGGNTAVNTDGTNFLGTLNVAPLVFKTAQTDGTPLERMRIDPTGRVGIGTTAPTAKVQVHTTTPTGVWARHLSKAGIAPAVRGDTSATVAGATGVQGTIISTSAGADSAAVRGICQSTQSGNGVVGTTAGSGQGVLGKSTNGTGVRGDGFYGMWAAASDTTNGYGAVVDGGYVGTYTTGDYAVLAYGETRGVLGSAFASGIGVEGRSSGAGAIGVRGYASGDGANGVVGDATGTNVPYGVWGIGNTTDGTPSYAGFFNGNVNVVGTLFKSAGSFRIDHPLEPAKKYLSHSFVESPDMMNVYNGNAELDADGTAEVTMPDWFEALNRDFRYQLTAIGAPGPELHVASTISGNSFRIGGGTSGMTVSWQVTGIRQDAYAKAHPIEVEQAKPPEEQGTYLTPREHGKRASTAVNARRLDRLRVEVAENRLRPPDLARR